MKELIKLSMLTVIFSSIAALPVTAAEATKELPATLLLAADNAQKEQPAALSTVTDKAKKETSNFNKLDFNHDSKISGREAEKDQWLSDNFETIDTNKDGQISPIEFIEGVNKS